MSNKILVIYDQECVMCSQVIRWLDRNDRHNDLVYFWDDEVGSKPIILVKNGKILNSQKSIIVVKEGQYYDRAAAILLIGKKIFPTSLWVRILSKIPYFVLNPFYNIISRYRYFIFGKINECVLPSEIKKDKFYKGQIDDFGRDDIQR